MNNDMLTLTRYLETHYSNCIDNFSNMSMNNSNVSLINSNRECFNFDLIVNNLFKKKLNSVDSLLLRNEVYFIEFKSGNLKGRVKETIKTKMATSLLIFQNVIAKEASINLDNIKINFILVIEDNANPIALLGKELKKLSKINNNIFINYIDNYKQYSNDKRVFFDNVTSCFSSNFVNELAILK